MAGVTSFIRSLAMNPRYYHCMLHFFHSDAINVGTLTHVWIKLCITSFKQFLLKENGRILIIADALKAPKEGRQMPGVKSLHQESDNNCKSEYTMGHYIESLAMIAGNKQKIFAIPLLGRIHGGVLFSKNDEKLNLIDRFIGLLKKYLFPISYYLITDAYYIAKKIMKYLISTGNHLITRMRSNVVAWKVYSGPVKTGSRGRPTLYGEKIKIRDFFKDFTKFKTANSPVYGEKSVKIKYRSDIVLLRPNALKVQVILVIHPTRGNITLVTTDLELQPLTAIKLYGYRFKIEITFKTAKPQLGSFGYHFWMRDMEKIKKKTGAQQLYNRSQSYKNKVERKLKAFTLFIQIGFIAQGLLQYLSLFYPEKVWKNFHSWLRTMNKKAPPSESFVSMVLRDYLFDFLRNLPQKEELKKFYRTHTDFSRLSGFYRRYPHEI